MTAPNDVLDKSQYSKVDGLDVKIDAGSQVVYLTIARGLELPVKVGVPFGAVAMMAAGVLQAYASIGGPNGNGAPSASPGLEG